MSKIYNIGGAISLYTNNKIVEPGTITLSRSIADFTELLIIFDNYILETATHTYTTMTVPTNKLNLTYTATGVFGYMKNWFGGHRAFYISSNTTIYFGDCYLWMDNSSLTGIIGKINNTWFVPVQIYGIK